MSNVISIHKNDPSLEDGLNEIAHNKHMTKLMAEMEEVHNFLEYLEDEILVSVDDVKFKAMIKYTLVNDYECEFKSSALKDYFMDRWSVIYNKMQHHRQSRSRSLLARLILTTHSYHPV